MDILSRHSKDKYSALWMGMPEYLDHKSNHSLNQTCTIIHSRSAERAAAFLKMLSIWDMRGCFSLDVYGKFVRSFHRWIGMRNSPNHVISFKTDIKYMKMVINTRYFGGHYVVDVSIKPDELFLNPASFSDGALVILTAIKDSIRFEAYVKSFSILLPSLPHMTLITPVTTRIRIDGAWHNVPDIRLVEMVTRRYEISSILKVTDIVYRLMVGFSRETMVHISQPYKDTENEYGFDLMRKLMT